jgi:SAM-dependent methyltransferase
MQLNPAEQDPFQRFQDKYQQGNTPWDTGIVPPEVVAYVEATAPGRAIDAGCGTGTSSVYLAQRGWTVTGVEWIQQAIERARARAEQAGLQPQQVHFMQADLTAADTLLDHPPVDLWLDIGCLHSFFEIEQRQAYLRHVQRLLAPGGLALVYAWGPHQHESGRQRGLDPDDMRMLFGSDFALEQVSTGREAQDDSIPAHWYWLRRSG